MARMVTGVKVTFSCVTSGERYDVVLNANQTPGTYWIHMRGLSQCALPGEEVYQLAVLRYIGTDQARNDPPGYDGGFAGNGEVCVHIMIACTGKQFFNMISVSYAAISIQSGVLCL
jgi:hypothetical protein